MRDNLLHAGAHVTGHVLIVDDDQVNLGKAGSMKLNYGGVSIEKKRRAIARKDEK